MNRSEKILFGFQSIMGLYGFTRGYRSYDSKDEIRLTTTKLMNGFSNAFFYTMPFVNIPSFLYLIDRFEIKIKGLDNKKKEFRSCYKEWTGFCDDDI